MAGRVDVLVFGAGPAGATIARRLAAQGYSVLLLKGPASRNPHAGSLPPGIRELLESAGIREEVERAKFYPNLGITRWWGDAEPSVETYDPKLKGYHVERGKFDRLLATLAERAGALVERNRRAPRVELEQGLVEHDGGLTQARFVVDATGRNGLLARQIQRLWDPRYRTMGLCGLLRAHKPWNCHPHHNLMEAYDRGWAWSVPLAPDRRYVCFYVDAETARAGEDAFRAELERTVEFLRLFEDAEFEAPAWLRDASLYYSDRCAASNWMLVGDAASFVDTLTGFGIEKAMTSAASGAETIRTCLESPQGAEAAIAAFNTREMQTWEDHARRAAAIYRAMLAWYNTPFWRDRSCC